MLPTPAELRAFSCLMVRYDDVQRARFERIRERLTEHFACQLRSQNPPASVKGEIPVRIGRPRGVRFHVAPECRGLPGIETASYFENGA